MNEPLRCLHCEQTRAEIRRDQTICGIEGGYEHRELIEEWPRHRWADWSDAALAAMRIRPEFYSEYRRHPATQFEYLPCEHILRGHNIVTEDWEWAKAGQCFDCGATP